MSERKKGKSLLKVPADYTIVDVETTGYDQRYDNIIEVGCIKYRGGQETARYNTLIKPPKNSGGNYVDGYIESLTGITNEMLSSAPTFDNVAKALWHFIEGDLLVGHNVNFDINFLYDTFSSFNSTWVLGNDFVDTLRIARRVLPELEHHRLEDLDDYFGIGIAHHRAVSDCETTNVVLQKLAAIIAERQIDLSNRGKWGKVDLRALSPESDSVMVDSPLYKKVCVFTGALERYTRVDAAQIVVNLGGLCGNNVTKATNFLIVGDFDYSSGVKGGKSNKLKRAEQLIAKGSDLQILSERVFYDMLSDVEEILNG